MTWCILTRITSPFGPWTIWPLDDLIDPPAVDLAQPVSPFGSPDVVWLCYLFIFPAISVIIRRGFERFYHQAPTDRMC